VNCVGRFVNESHKSVTWITRYILKIIKQIKRSVIVPKGLDFIIGFKFLINVKNQKIIPSRCFVTFSFIRIIMDIQFNDFVSELLKIFQNDTASFIGNSFSFQTVVSRCHHHSLATYKLCCQSLDKTWGEKIQNFSPIKL